MCKETFQSPSGMLCDKPMSMTELTLEKICDFDYKYGAKFNKDFSDDFKAIDKSMMRSPKVRRRRKVKRKRFPTVSCVPLLEDIKENELFEPEEAIKDLADVHRERALSCGFIKEESSRRCHQKRYVKKGKRNS